MGYASLIKEIKMNPYKKLNIPKDATDEEIKAAYRDKAKSAHPDQGGIEEDFQELANAYALLKSPERREYFDQFGEDKPQDISRNKAIIMLNDIITQMVQGAEPEELIHENIIKVMRDAIFKNHTTLAEETQKVDYQLKKLLRMEEMFDKRLKQKSENDNLFKTVLSTQINLLKHNLLHLDNQKSVLDTAIKMLENYEFDFVPKPEINADEIEAQMRAQYLHRAMQNGTYNQHNPFGGFGFRGSTGG